MFFRFLTYFTEAVGDEIIIKLILPVNVPFLLNPWFYVRRLCMYLYIWHRTGSEHKATLFVFFGVSFERPYVITGLNLMHAKATEIRGFHYNLQILYMKSAKSVKGVCMNYLQLSGVLHINNSVFKFECPPGGDVIQFTRIRFYVISSSNFFKDCTGNRVFIYQFGVRLIRLTAK